ncbi:MAG: hypothetical protein N3G21_03785 [Candidatus Hydrogenedentes bacterium]|nr:hypothetical protein [Candidatus Hydrogenedentota bacterium]
MVTQCCVCKKILDKDRNKWIYLPNAEFSKVTHTYCPSCIEITRKLFGLKPRKPQSPSNIP